MLIIWKWALFVAAVYSSPANSLFLMATQKHIPKGHNSSSEPTPVVYGESEASRTIYTVVSLFCLSLLTGMLGMMRSTLHSPY
jgi:hypothetical protein